MRPTATAQNPLRNPLNHVLSTEAQVRLLRVLCAANGPLSVTDAADRADLTPPGARKAMRRLVKTGFIVRVGAGRDRQYQLRREDPLTPAIEELFRAEQSRFQDLLKALRDLFEDSETPPRSAWIGSFPREPDESLEVGVLHDARQLSGFLRSVRPAVARVESRFDLTIELRGYTRADLPPMDDEDYSLVAGIPPVRDRDREPSSTNATHEERARQSLARARRLADLIEQDPSLVERARRSLEDALEEGQGTADADLREWLAILESYPITRLQRFLVSESARAARLRQSSPFFAVLTDDERRQLGPARGLAE